MKRYSDGQTIRSAQTVATRLPDGPLSLSAPLCVYAVQVRTIASWIGALALEELFHTPPITVDSIWFAWESSRLWMNPCLTFLLCRIASPVRHPHHQDQVCELGQVAWWQSWAHAGAHEQSLQFLLGGKSTVELRQARTQCFSIRGQAILGWQVCAQKVGWPRHESRPSDFVWHKEEQIR